MATVAQTPTATAAVAEKPTQQKKAKKAISPGISLLSGGVAGAVEATATVSFSDGDFCREVCAMDHNLLTAHLLDSTLSSSPRPAHSFTARQAAQETPSPSLPRSPGKMVSVPFTLAAQPSSSALHSRQA